MKTKDSIIEEALMRIKKDDGTNEIGDYMSAAMDEWAKQTVISFTNWTLQVECMYSCDDEDQWTHTETGERVTTEQLYSIYEKQNK